MLEQLYPYSYLNFTCDNCGEEFRNKTAYSPIKNAKQSDQFLTYCFNCVEITEEKPKKTQLKLKKDKRITGRTKQLNLKVKEETYWLMRKLACKEKKLMTEVLEKVLIFYQRYRKS